MSAPSCAIVVMSCDAYKDIWCHFFGKFWKYWERCPYPVFLASNRAEWTDTRVVSLRQYDVQDWSGALQNAVRQIDADTILLIIDDHLLDRPVHSSVIATFVSLFADADVNYVRLAGRPRPERNAKVLSGIVGEIPPGTVYRTATVMSLWRRECLLRLLRPGETAWDFEISGANRSDGEPGFYAAFRDAISYQNVIVKGRWRPSVLTALLQDGTLKEPVQRKVMSRPEEWWLSLRVCLNAALYVFPVGCQRQIRSIFRR